MAGMSPCSGMQWCWPFFSSLVGHCFVRGIDALYLLSKLLPTEVGQLHRLPL
jgi:hypothetical protein